MLLVNALSYHRRYGLDAWQSRWFPDEGMWERQILCLFRYFDSYFIYFCVRFPFIICFFTEACPMYTEEKQSRLAVPLVTSFTRCLTETYVPLNAYFPPISVLWSQNLQSKVQKEHYVLSCNSDVLAAESAHCLLAVTDWNIKRMAVTKQSPDWDSPPCLFRIWSAS